MASSFLVACGSRGAFKILKLQVWNLRSLPSTVSVCTKPEDSKTASTKNKDENVSSSTSEETIKLKDEGLKKFRANKTLVTFPQRALFLSPERELGFSSTGGSNEKPDEETSSSSSSESDSSSDEEGNVIKDTLKTKVAFPSRDPISSEQRTVKENTSEQQFHQSQKEGNTSEKHLYSPIILESPFKQKGVVFSRQNPISSEDRTMKVNINKQQLPTSENSHALQDSSGITEPLFKEKRVSQTIVDKLSQPDLVKHVTKQTSKEKRLKSTDLGINPAESERSIASQLETSVPEATPSKLSETQQQSMMAQSRTLLRQEESASRGVQDAESQGRDTVEVQEEFLDDAAPVVETTMMEEISVETEIQDEAQSIAQEVEAAVETAQEAIDISTYKNLQHHEYTPFTFVDYDVELAKFRLPQPSSGKVSPRH